jgi:hypothetical protein
VQALDIQPIVDWLDAGVPGIRGPESLLATLNQKLLAAGIPLARVAVFVRTLHPNVAGRAFFWRAEKPGEVDVDVAEHDWIESEQHLTSPLHAITSTGQPIRRCLADPDCPMDFPVLADLRKEGMTDYFATPLPSLTGEKLLASYTTRQPGGFTEVEMAALARLLAPVGRVAEVMAWRRKAQNILETYLGRQAGEKVLAGQIRRGDGEDMHAVIWFCDLRDSTPLAESTASTSASEAFSRDRIARASCSAGRSARRLSTPRALPPRSRTRSTTSIARCAGASAGSAVRSRRSTRSAFPRCWTRSAAIRRRPWRLSTPRVARAGATTGFRPVSRACSCCSRPSAGPWMPRPIRTCLSSSWWKRCNLNAA